MTAPTGISVESRYAPATSTAPAPAPGDDVAEPRWHPATLTAFRFTFVYFTAYVLLTQMLSTMIVIPGFRIPELGGLGPFRRIVLWVGPHVLGIANPFSAQLTGSGDKTFDWVQAFTLLLVAALATMIWSAVARERTNHARLYAAFRVFLRFALGTTLLSYGFAKLVPLQMAAPGLVRLLEPFGDFSPMGVLWSSIGASRPYETITGAAEVAGGLLVLIPQTTKIGAILCLVDTADVFALNITYDVPVKLFSFQLVVMSLVLIAPDARRLVRLPPRAGRPPHDGAHARGFGDIAAHRDGSAARLRGILRGLGDVLRHSNVASIRRWRTQVRSLWNLGGAANDDRRCGAPATAHRFNSLASGPLRCAGLHADSAHDRRPHRVRIEDRHRCTYDCAQAEHRDQCQRKLRAAGSDQAGTDNRLHPPRALAPRHGRRSRWPRDARGGNIPRPERVHAA